MDKTLKKCDVKYLEIHYSQLPLFIKFKGKEKLKEYVLMNNKEFTNLFLNKKEY